MDPERKPVWLARLVAILLLTKFTVGWRSFTLRPPICRLSMAPEWNGEAGEAWTAGKVIGSAPWFSSCIECAQAQRAPLVRPAIATGYVEGREPPRYEFTNLQGDLACEAHWDVPIEVVHVVLQLRVDRISCNLIRSGCRPRGRQALVQSNDI